MLLDEGLGGRAVARGCVLAGDGGSSLHGGKVGHLCPGMLLFYTQNKRSAWTGKGTKIYLSRPRRLSKMRHQL